MKKLPVRTVLLAAMVVLLTAGWLEAQAQAPATKKVTTVEGITEYQLDNGLRVLLFPDPSAPTVTVNLTVFVGSRHEGYGETGMAHLLEHMVFKGTPTFPDIPKALKEHGAAGSFNGTTWVDRTNYFETLPATDANLEFALHMEADRMINSFIRRDDLLSEMTVVRNEFEMGENSPGNILSQRMTAVAYEWHNYGKSTIGNRSDIERVPIENLQAFYRKFYQPDNAMLVVAGQFDEAKALQYVQKYFGTIPKPTRKLDTTYTEEPAQDGERVVTLRRVGDVGLVGVIYHISAGPHPDFAAVQVLSNILNSEPSGRLYKALVETKKASSVGGAAYAFHDPGVIEVAAEVRKGNSLEEARDIMLSVMEEVGAKGVTDEELQRAKTQILNDREKALANSRRLAVDLSNWAAQGDWRLFFLHRDRVEKVTAEDVKRVATKYLQRNNRTVGMYIPTDKAERVAVPATPDVKSLVADYKGREGVAAGEAFDVSPTHIESRTQRSEIGGVKVALLPKKTRGELVNLRLTLRYGNQDNLRDLVAAAEFLPDLMTRGTKKLSYQQLQDELDKQKARLSASGGTGTTTFTIQTKRENLPATLELLRQVLREATLPADQFEVMKRERLARLEQQRTDPGALSRRSLQRQLSPYPKDDVRYIPTIDEEIQRVQGVTLDQVKKLYQEHLGAQAGELSIVGDFDPAGSTKLLREALAGWKAALPYARIERPAAKDIKAGTEKINTPDKANATYGAGLVLPLKDDNADYPALVMANYILGGSFSSRLTNRVRHKEGLSYGVGSGFNASALDARAGLSVFAICNPENMPKVEKAILDEVEKLVRDGVSQEELDKAKEAYLQQQRVARTNDTQLAGTLGDTLHEGRTMNHYTELEKKLDALTPAQISAALRKHLDPKKLVIVTAGDFEKKPAGGGN